MQVFAQKKSNKKYIYYVYIVKGVFFPFWGIHPMVILWSSYDDPMVRVLYSTEKREGRLNEASLLVIRQDWRILLLRQSRVMISG